MIRPSRHILVIALLTFALLGGWHISRTLHSKSTSKNLPSPVSTKAEEILTPQPTPTSTPNPKTTTLLFGGDVMLGRAVERNMKKFGYSWPLQNLAPTMNKADITVVNLESPFSSTAPSTSSNSLILRGDPGGIINLTNAGVDVVSLANNHITDMGTTGLSETTDLLSTNNILFTGAGRTTTEAEKPVIIERNGIRFGFLSYAYGVNIERAGIVYNKATPTAVTSDIQTLKPQADLIVVLCHCGTEYRPTANQDQEAFAHAAIDAGASIVIGHHPHIPEPVEQYKTGLIIYSLGNLVFDQDEVGNRNFSALASITITGNRVTGLSLLPYQIFKLGQPSFIEDVNGKERIWKLFNLPGGTWTAS